MNRNKVLLVLLFPVLLLITGIIGKMKAASCGEDLDGLLKLKEIYISMSNGVIGMSVASIVISSAVIYLVRLEKE